MINYKVIGVMSGTSCDGVDLAYCDFSLDQAKNWTYSIKKAVTVPYHKAWQDRLRGAIELSPKDLVQVNLAYTNLLNQFILDFINREQIENLDLICSHGHTVRHQPDFGTTLQIGNLKELTQDLPCPVVCDFRVQDVAFGGQGAPLVPIGDRLLFGDYSACLNLGGFANVSYLYPDKKLHMNQVSDWTIAFDIAPLNIVLNHFAQKLGAPYDDKGVFAQSGQLDRSLLARLNALDYYTQPPPKSLGLEWVQTNIVPLYDEFQLSSEDWLATLVGHMAHQIERICQPFDRVLVTGGGAFNDHLINELNLISSGRYLVPSSDLVMFKEALIFGLLGVLRWRNEINCLSSVTGASHDHSSGIIWPKPEI